MKTVEIIGRKVNIVSMGRGGNCAAQFEYVKNCPVERLIHVAPRCKLRIEGKRLRKTNAGLRFCFNVRNSFLTFRVVP